MYPGLLSPAVEAEGKGRLVLLIFQAQLGSWQRDALQLPGLIAGFHQVEQVLWVAG